MHRWTGRLGGDDGCFLLEHPLPARFDGLGIEDGAGKVEEDEVMAVLGGVQPSVKSGEFGIGAVFGEELETFAGAGLDERRDHQPIHEFEGAFALADQAAQGLGVGVSVGA